MQSINPAYYIRTDKNIRKYKRGKKKEKKTSEKVKTEKKKRNVQLDPPSTP